MSDFYVTYSEGPRYIDGQNIDLDCNASLPTNVVEVDISDPVQGLRGKGYQPGQENKDGRLL